MDKWVSSQGNGETDGCPNKLMGGWMNIGMVGIQWFGKDEHSKNISCL